MVKNVGTESMTEKITQVTNIATTLKNQEEMRMLSQESSSIFYAIVISKDDDGTVRLKTDNGEIIGAVTMLSCLVEVVEQDKVLVIKDNLGNNYISNIISRLSEEALAIDISTRDLILKAGNISLHTNVLATNAMDIAQSSNEFQTYAKKMVVASEEYEHMSQKANINVQEVNSIFQTFSTKIRNLFEKIGVVSRDVDQIEKINSNMRQDTIKNQLVINAGSAQINSKSSFQVNARQVFMN